MADRYTFIKRLDRIMIWDFSLKNWKNIFENYRGGDNWYVNLHLVDLIEMFDLKKFWMQSKAKSTIWSDFFQFEEIEAYTLYAIWIVV